MSDQQHRRVLNRIRKVDLDSASPKKRAVISLLRWQPGAQRIRLVDQCHCRQKALLVTYQTDGISWRVRGGDAAKESCGYYCPTCGFSNAGSRKIQEG